MPSGKVSRALASPIEKRGDELLCLPEDQWFERKSFRVEPRKLAEALVGFANSDGGVLVVGLCDGRVEGTRADPRHRNALMQAVVDFTTPPVRARHALHACKNQHGARDDLLVFEIEPGTRLHATARDEVFLRVGDETRKLTYAQRRELTFDKGEAAYETEPSGVDVSEVDNKLLTSYANRVQHPDPFRLLRARGLADGDMLSIAGCLLFAHNPQRVMPNAHVRVSRFDGRERGLGARQRMREDVRIEGPIPRALNQARETIGRWQPRRRALGRAGVFEDVPLVPEDAWLEGVVNAVVHRSYSLAGDHIHVDVFDDRIEIESPGRFPGLARLDDPLQVMRFARNPRLARVCADLQIGQELGEGIRRMFEEMRLAGLDEPLYQQTAGSVRLTLSGDAVKRDRDDRLPPETRAIVAALRDAGQLSTGEIAEVLGVARPTAIRRLEWLREASIIEWVGKSAKDPHAHWRLAR